MYGVLRGVKVVEVSSWLLLCRPPALVLADWGAEVIKVEHPELGDPIRGLTNAENSGAIMNPNTELPNRGKRSAGIDASRSEEGREILYRLIDSADTSSSPTSSRALDSACGSMSNMCAPVTRASSTR